MHRHKIKKRRTVGAVGPYAAAEPGMYTHMFAEDIHNGIMGFRFGLDEGRHIVRIEGDPAGKKALGTICGSLSDYERYDIAENVQSAVESIATRLAWYGKAIYEICNEEGIVALASVPPYRLHRIPGGFVQFISKKEQRWAGTRRYAFLPEGSAWVVRLPRPLGTPKAHQGLLAELTAVSKTAPEFWIQELNAGKTKTQFPFSDYNRNRDAYIARITSRWGWNRRDSSGTNHTEFFYFFRSLRFRQAQAFIRDHIIDDLNRLMVRLGINACIKLEGFRTATEIQNLIDGAVAGSLHYADALRQAT
jgi:hypothetical protein